MWSDAPKSSIQESEIRWEEKEKKLGFEWSVNIPAQLADAVTSRDWSLCTLAVLWATFLSLMGLVHLKLGGNPINLLHLATSWLVS